MGTPFRVSSSERTIGDIIGDDAVAAIQDGMLGWMDRMLRWMGIREFKVVGFKLKPTDDPGRWQGGFLIREEGCDQDRLIDGEWIYEDTPDERFVAMQAVVTRRCDGSERQMTMLMKYGLGFVDGGEMPRYQLTAGDYAALDTTGCRHTSTPSYVDDTLVSISIRNHCDDQTIVFTCESNWCSGVDMTTHIQVTGDDQYTVNQLFRNFVYTRQ